MSDSSPTACQTKPAEDRFQVRHRFIGLVFALAATEVLRQGASCFSTTLWSWAAVSHLGLCLVLIASSWVGWSNSIANKSPLKGVIDGQFIDLLLDLLLVFVYFAMVLGVEIGQKGDAAAPAASASREAWGVCFVFALYLLWDIVSDVVGRKGVPWPYSFAAYASSSLACLALCTLTLAIAIPSRTVAAVILIDAALVCVVMFFRAMKHFEGRIKDRIRSHVQAPAGSALEAWFLEADERPATRRHFVVVGLMTLLYGVSLGLALMAGATSPVEGSAPPRVVDLTWIATALAAGTPLFAAFGLGLGFTRLMLGLSSRFGFVDRPGAHKAHGREVPLGGGVAITAAVVAPIALGSLAVWLHHKGTITLPAPESIRPHLTGMAERVPSLLKIVGCALFLMVVGVIDDRRPLPPLPKFAAQFAAAIVTAWPLGVRVAEALPAPLSIALTVLWIVVITNAFNFLDNMDGLSAGVGAIASIVFAVAALRAGQVFVPMIALTLGGALLGFLVFNFAPARIFMGDAGSLVIGYLMSVVTILTTYYEPGRAMTPLALIVPLLVLAVPLYDVCSVVVIRLRAGDSPFRGDRRHFSHRLKRRGLSTRGAVLTIYLATAATGLPAIALPRADWFASALILLQCVCVVTIIAILEGQDAASDPPEPRA